jgi:hypothetical protein
VGNPAPQHKRKERKMTDEELVKQFASANVKVGMGSYRPPLDEYDELLSRLAKGEKAIEAMGKLSKSRNRFLDEEVQYSSEQYLVNIGIIVEEWEVGK